VTDHLGRTHLVGSPLAKPAQIEANDETAADTSISPLDNPVCWIEGYEIEVAAQSFSRFYVTSDLQGHRKRHQHTLMSWYKLCISAHSGTDLVVKLRCKAEHVDSEHTEHLGAEVQKSTFSLTRLEAAKSAFIGGGGIDVEPPVFTHHQRSRVWHEKISHHVSNCLGRRSG